MAIKFIQMADPQFGMFSSISKLTKEEAVSRSREGLNLRYVEKEFDHFEPEIKLFTKAIVYANEYKPDFVVMCGDMVHDADSLEQRAELLRITDQLDKDIPIYWVAGNHDVGNSPTTASLESYRKLFGPDNYSFQKNNCSFIAINSSVCSDPTNVPEEWEFLIEFLKKELSKASDNGSLHKIVFLHHPLFLETANEADNYFTIPSQRRRQIIDLLDQYKVSAVFSGHLHRNNYKSLNGIEYVSSGPVGYPLDDDPSGIRIVDLDSNGLDHRYISLE
ncbi:MAG: metallophosphoesterase [Dehalococcoidia bacterium]